MNRREEVIAAVRKVEKMPSSIQQALALLSDPDSDVGAVARALEHDPGLTANILRMANSSYFGGVRAITSVREAVVRMGGQHVFKLVLATGIAPHARKQVRGYDLAPGSLLRHSVTVALAAEELGRQLNLRIPDHTFTSGLVSNLGKIVLGTFLDIDVGPILKLVSDKGLTFEQAEDKVLGINHAEVGAELMEYWGLPEPIVLVVRHRLDPDKFDGVDLALDLVHVADVLAKNTGAGLGIDGMCYFPSQTVINRLKLSYKVLDRTLAAIMDHVNELSDLFRSI